MIENIEQQNDYIESPLFEREEFHQLMQEIVGSNTKTYDLNQQSRHIEVKDEINSQDD